MKGDPAATRARHWARWQRGRAVSAWRHRAHLDALRSDARAAWVCSWQRSGSTLLAELLASAPRTRLVYEPANVPGALFSGELAAREAMPEGPGPELDAVERALRGQLSGAWVDQLAEGHLVARRVIKDVRAMGLLGLVAARHPRTPVVVLVRHPLSVARSAVALGWTRDPDAPLEAQLLDEVRRWAAVHATALSVPTASRCLVLAYEHLVTEPHDALARLTEYLEGHHRTWHGLAMDRGRLDAPSATDFRGTGGTGARDWIGTFDGLDGSVVAAAADVLAETGLAELYATSPLPLVGAGEVGDALRRAGPR